MFVKHIKFILVFVAVFGFVAMPVFASVVEPNTAKMNVISFEFSSDSVNPSIFIDRAYLSATYFDSSPLWVDGLLSSSSTSDAECEAGPLDDHTCSVGFGYSAPWGEVEAISDNMELGFNLASFGPLEIGTTYYFRILVWDNDFDTALQSAEFSFVFSPYAPVSLSEEITVGSITGMIGTVSNVLGGALPVVVGILALMIGIFMVWRIVKRNIGSPK